MSMTMAEFQRYTGYVTRERARRERAYAIAHANSHSPRKMRAAFLDEYLSRCARGKATPRDHLRARRMARKHNPKQPTTLLGATLLQGALGGVLEAWLCRRAA